MDNQSNQKIDLDLDALASEYKRVKLKGNEVKIYAPDVKQIMSMMQLGDLLKDFQKDNADPDVIKETIDKLESVLRECVSELGDMKLNIAQIFGLMNLIVNMAIPENVKELQTKGVEVEGEKKSLIGQENLPDSSTTTITPTAI